MSCTFRPYRKIQFFGIILDWRCFVDGASSSNYDDVQGPVETFRSQNLILPLTIRGGTIIYSGPIVVRIF